MTVYRHLTTLGLGRGRRPTFQQWLAVHTRHDGDCLRWTGAHSTDGRPMATLGRAKAFAHRLVWEYHHGSLQADIRILQSDGCHFRDCVEITHLRAVGHHEFIDELTQAQVFPWGEQHWNAKLTESQARTIRANTATSAQDLAQQFGVSAGTINAIRSRRRWAHLDQKNGPGDVPRAPGRRRG